MDVEAHYHANGRYKIRVGSNEHQPVGSFGSSDNKSSFDETKKLVEDNEKKLDEKLAEQENNG